MKGVNKMILVGTLGRDPERREMPSGGGVTNISVATSESWKDKATGQMQERTEWHKVVFFNRLADIAAEFLTKGSHVYVEGALRTRKYQKDGVDHYSTEIVASEMQMLGGGERDSAQRASTSTAPAARPAPAAQQPKPKPDFDDDIPF